jgi:ubiquitin-activating enzyme E1
MTYFRRHNVPLVIADTRGLFAQIFTDFGEKFVVYDVDGQVPVSIRLSSITAKGVVTTVGGILHGFEDGDTVMLSEVEGMTQLNGTKHKISVHYINKIICLQSCVCLKPIFTFNQQRLRH